MKRWRLAIALAGVVCVGLAAGYWALHLQKQWLRDSVTVRFMRECAIGPSGRKPADQAALLRELVGLRRWLAQHRSSREPVDLGSWCLWTLEKQAGLRDTLPTGGPPRARDLPDVSGLIGLARERLLSELGEPSYGCHIADRPGVWSKAPCADAPSITYDFYHLPDNWLGGGRELALDFDERGVCVRAEWAFSQ